jgi:hypothetical protein
MIGVVLLNLDCWGIESLALDLNNPAKLYMLAGTSYFIYGKTAILIQNDYGATFTVVDVSNQFKAHGNGMGRQTGEKLAVDPKISNILFCGNRRDGLFKSTMVEQHGQKLRHSLLHKS